MSEAAIFIAIGVTFLVLLLWLLRNRDGVNAATALIHARIALERTEIVPPSTLVARIFSAEDLAFVSAHAPLEVRRLFEQERKRIAILWLRHNRRIVSSLMREHRTAVRGNPQLSGATEGRLALEYFRFLALCSALQVLTWMGGPFWLRRMARLAAGAAETVTALRNALISQLRPESPATGWPDFQGRDVL